MIGLLGLLQGLPGAVAEADDPQPGSYQVMEYGPVIGGTVAAEWPAKNIALKGLAIRSGGDAAMIFDTDLLRWSAATVGGWVDLAGTSRTSYKGSRHAQIEGRQVFGTARAPGWARQGDFSDPRKGGLGNLPRDWAHWKGYYRYRDRVALHYSVGEAEILEIPGSLRTGDDLIFARQMHTSGSAEPIEGYLAELPEGTELRREGESVVAMSGPDVWVFRVESDLPGAGVRPGEGHRVEFVLPPHEGPAQTWIWMVETTVDGVESLPERLAAAAVDLELDPNEVRAGGAGQWAQPVIAPVEMAGADAAYVVDRIGLPSENPWGSWFRPSGFDFFADGTRAAVSTWNGDVWIVSGLGGGMEEVRWERFASGLFYPMGVVVVDEVVHLTERGQLTRLHDVNRDGEADYYENVNNDGPLHPRAHTLALEVDSEGNFYFFKNGNRAAKDFPGHGALIRVSADGGKREVFANGIRGANTLGIGPGDTILGADQQGDWVPTARVDWLREGRFYGYRGHGGEGVPVGEFEPPVCWIPHRVDNSTGGIAYLSDERWGPLHGNWVTTSYGQGAVFALLTEMKGDRMQGGVVQFPLKFDSGLMRARVNPSDGQLYVLGLKGWQTRGAHDGSFDRVRFTGLPNRMPIALSVSRSGVEVGFSEPLEREALSVEDFEVKRWQYVYSGRYGSPEMSVENPDEPGRDPVEVSSVSLSGDGRTVSLQIPDMRRVMQMMVRYRVTFADGETVENAIYHTVNRLTDDQEESEPPLIVSAPGPASAKPDEEDLEEEVPAFPRGKEIFGTTCSQCHRPASEAGIAPPLSHSDWMGGSSAQLIRILLHGKEGSQGVMMPFGSLSDEELAEVLSYIRTRWHQAEPIAPEEVEAVREETEGRTDLWTDEELRELLD